MFEYQLAQMADSKSFVPLAPLWHAARDGLDRWSDPAAHIERSAVNDLAAGAGAPMFDSATGFPATSAERSLLQLQRRYGNRYVQRALALTRHQDKEREIPLEMEQGIERTRGRKRSAESKLRQETESAFGRDFGGAPLHTGPEADGLNRSVSFTAGRDTFFPQGDDETGSSAQRELLAHKSTHVVQQSDTAIRGKLVAGQPGDQYEQEADRAAMQVARTPDRRNADPPALFSAAGTDEPLSCRCACNGHLDLQTGCASSLQRQPQSASGQQEHLQSPRFAPSDKLERCSENKDRLAENDPDSDAVTRIQRALLDLPGITGNVYDLGATGADGRYGPKTAAAIRKFKTDENLGSTEFGDVGPGTMHRLDQLFASGPPKPGPQQQPVLALDPSSGPAAGASNPGAAYTIKVSGDKFTANIPLAITFDDTEESHQTADGSGHFQLTIRPAIRPPGNYEVRAFNPLKGSDDATATFSVAGGVGPQLNVTCQSFLQPSGVRTSTVQLMGTGFTAGTGITVTLDDKLSGFTSADDEGSFVFDVKVDGVSDGPHSIFVISGGNETAQAALTLPCPTPTPGPFNQTLEDVLDAIWVEHAHMFQLEQNALVRLESDLQPSLQEMPSDFALQFLGRAAVDVIAALFNAQAIPWVGKAIVDVLQSSNSPDVAQAVGDWAVTPVLAGVTDSTKGQTEDAVKDALKPDPAQATAQLGAFIDGQKAGLLQQESEKQQSFILESRPKARQFPTHPSKAAACAEPDARVCDALAALAALHKAEQDRQDAFTKQYTTAAEKWTVTIAQAALGTAPTPGGGAGTNLGSGSKDDPRGARGVLTFEYGATDPLGPSGVQSATIAGLSEITRGKLNTQLASTKVGDLGMPRVATGCVDQQVLVPGHGCPGTFEVAKNEVGTIFVRGANSDGEDWLVKKGAVAASVPTKEAGAAAVWGQIDAILVKDLNNGKGIAGPAA
jgi:peptidoglycan hydrolase-like protein with peptidoglycan-binding domain